MQSRCHARAAYLLSKGANDGLKNAEGLTCYEGLSAVCVRARGCAVWAGWPHCLPMQDDVEAA